MSSTIKMNAAAVPNEEGRPTLGNDALGGVISFLNGIGKTANDKAGTEGAAVPQLAASSSSDGITDKPNETNGVRGSWLERLACAVDMDSACRLAKGGEPVNLPDEEAAEITKDTSVDAEAKSEEAGQPESPFLAKARGGALLKKMDRELEQQREHLADLEQQRVLADNEASHLFDAAASLSILNASDKVGLTSHHAKNAGSPVLPPGCDFAALLDLFRQRRASDTLSLSAVRLVLGREKWSAALSMLSPDEYAALIALVDSEFDIPEVAALAAKKVDGRLFDHEYVLAALDVVADHGRAPLLARLMPLCADGASRMAKERVRARLSEWQVECAGPSVLTP